MATGLPAIAVIGVIPAAGEGTRLRPLTEDVPKGMVDVAGEPLLEHVLDTAVESGVDELVVVVGYGMAAIVDAFGDEYRDRPITYVHQRERLGLGHAVARAGPHVDGPFLVLNGDNVFEEDCSAACRLFVETDVDAIVVVEEVSRETARTTGVVEVESPPVEGATDVDGFDPDRLRGRVTALSEKPDDPPSTLATTGCYVLPEAVFDALSLLRPSDRGEYELTDAVGVLVRAGATVLAVDAPGERVNVNTERDLEAAAALVEDR